MPKKRSKNSFSPPFVDYSQCVTTGYKIHPSIKGMCKYFADSRKTTMSDIVNAALFEFLKRNRQSETALDAVALAAHGMFRDIYDNLTTDIYDSAIKINSPDIGKAPSGHHPIRNDEKPLKGEENPVSGDSYNWDD